MRYTLILTVVCFVGCASAQSTVVPIDPAKPPLFCPDTARDNPDATWHKVELNRRKSEITYNGQVAKLNCSNKEYCTWQTPEWHFHVRIDGYDAIVHVTPLEGDIVCVEKPPNCYADIGNMYGGVCTDWKVYFRFLQE